MRVCTGCASVFSASVKHSPQDCQMYKNWWINRDWFNWRVVEVHPTWFHADNSWDG